VIVHFLEKNENQQSANVDFSRDLLPINVESIELVEKLHASYRKASITYANFNDRLGKVFPSEFKSYLNILTPEAFRDFSQNAIYSLRDIIANIPPAKGGFLVFAEYEIDGSNYLSVYLIRDTKGMLFEKKDDMSSYVIQPTEHLDLDKLAMACRVDVDGYQNQQNMYLSFIKRKMSDISQYFVNWISVSSSISNKILTENLFELINLAEHPVNEYGNKISLVEFQKSVFDYVSSSPSNSVNLNSISRHFYENERYLQNLATKNELLIDTEFLPNPRIMKQFLQIRVNSDGIRIDISRRASKRKIRFDAVKKDIVIIQSAKFASDLRKEINETEDI